jgi:hypothetical protein
LHYLYHFNKIVKMISLIDLFRISRLCISDNIKNRLSEIRGLLGGRTLASAESGTSETRIEKSLRLKGPESKSFLETVFSGQKERPADNLPPNPGLRQERSGSVTPFSTLGPNPGQGRIRSDLTAIVIRIVWAVKPVFAERSVLPVTGLRGRAALRRGRPAAVGKSMTPPCNG